MITDQTTSKDFIHDRKHNYAHIKGWGIDADRKNDPTYPIKQRNNAEHRGYSWQRPLPQDKTVEILQSVERPNLTAVFGTSVPPAGISGMVRRVAFKYSESSYGRWLPLMLADRVQVLEGIVKDLSSGHIPNIPKELGLSSEWKYNRKAMLTKAAVGLLVAGAVIFRLCRSGKRP
ncbi:hypothetical protein K7A41_12225 [Sphingobacterium sp. InxBP1]|uniref:hypothetical protein n=1 Tax=Sphingobacterium TaxID=28453 RepID=UPI002243E668|nr:hypothetical protein [Sphingobacterium sp. InxBP1]MCW8311991.1 hypothetical protein [Sphingobacterium sp. InxBP1]